MLKILAVITIVAAATFGVWWYHGRTTTTSFSGDVVARDGQFPQTASVTPTEPNAADPAQAAPPQNQGTPQSDVPGNLPNAAAEPDASLAPLGSPATEAAGPLPNMPGAATAPYNGTALATPPPAHDTEPANLPNNLRVSGAGSYQWYRQGDLTWRVDTQSGRSCVDFATLDQWRNPVVYSHGCRGS